MKLWGQIRVDHENLQLLSRGIQVYEKIKRFERCSETILRYFEEE